MFRAAKRRGDNSLFALDTIPFRQVSCGRKKQSRDDADTCNADQYFEECESG